MITRLKAVGQNSQVIKAVCKTKSCNTFTGTASDDISTILQNKPALTDKRLANRRMIKRQIRTSTQITSPHRSNEQMLMFAIFRLRSLSSESSGKLKVLWLDGDSLGVDSGQVGVLEQGNEISFTCFLKCQNSTRLEAHS